MVRIAGVKIDGPEITRIRFQATGWIVVAFIITAGIWIWFRPFREAEDLLVVGYDSSRAYITEVSELYADTGKGKVQSYHAGSVRQAENIIRGLSADVVFLASQAEMDSAQSRTGCLDPEWKAVFPHGSSPVYSTIVLLVRKGNPYQISEWEDLYDRRIRVAMPDPRWSGAGRYAYLALMADALRRHDNNEEFAREEVRSLLQRMKLIPLGAQSAFNVFARSTREDVFLTWESEAMRITGSGGTVPYEVVYPPISIKAEPVVAVMACQADKRNTTESARAFIAFLFSPEAQDIAIRHNLRPSTYGEPMDGTYVYPAMELVDVETLFGTWEEVWHSHLGPDGSFSYAMKIRTVRDGGVE